MADVIEVFADISCPFAHVGLTRLVAERSARGRRSPRLWVRAWPLELVNGAPLIGPALVPKIAALRAGVAPDLFAAFDPRRFPDTTLPALAAEAAAYRVDVEVGEAFSLDVRRALFEHGRDVTDAAVLAELRVRHGVPCVAEHDDTLVLEDLDDGRHRHVIGSPHFFTPDGSFFCPSLTITHDGDEYEVRFDEDGFRDFAATAFA